MLVSLHVKNVALISDVELSFSSGLNIITGETGAGKSILVGALGLVLGKRADSSILRNKTDKCVIEAEFNIVHKDLVSHFESRDLDYEDLTILRREITVSGKSRAFINDTPVNLKELHAFGEKMIEIHSQYDNLQLFRKDFQFQVLDLLAGSHGAFQNYKKKFEDYQDQQNVLASLKANEALLAKESDFNRFLFNELYEANLTEVDEQGLVDEQEMLENADELIKTLNEADQLFSRTDFSILDQLRSLLSLLKNASTARTKQINERIASVIIELEDISAEISDAAESVEINPERLEQVNETLGLLFNLKNKHRVENVSQLIRLQDELKTKLSKTESVAEDIEKLSKKLKQMEESLHIMANNIAISRKKAVESVEHRINTDLNSLGMEHSRISFELSETELSNYGIDDLTIRLSSDKGKTFIDLKKSASGGELARLNLSVKNALSGLIKMPSSIFDEIDTGVSGEIARKVGSMMKEMGNEQQIIVITHLPQIASLGDHHLFVYKTEENGLVATQVRTLNASERIEEIAKMISGENLTEHAVEQSKALLKG